MFQGNPLSTFIGKKIEYATRPELESDDWALNLEICDMINESDDDAKDAARAIKKRLQQIEQDRNFTITNRTLTVLETCVSNCSHRFHVLVMTKDFTQDLVKLIGPKNNPPIDLQERVLRLIERWAEAFRSQPDLNGVVTVYNELRSKGVTFPSRDTQPNVPIQTPQRTVAAHQPPSPSALRSQTMSRSQQRAEQLAPLNQSPGPVVLEGDGYNKISQDLGVVQTSVDMFNDILRHLESTSDESDWKLAADLNTTCRQMKERIVDLIERVANEDLTIELLRLNDDLNNIFIKYDRLVKNRFKSAVDPTQAANSVGLSGAMTSTASVGQVPSGPTRTENELSLIDFNADDSAGGDKVQKPTQPSVLDPFDSAAVSAAFSAGGNQVKNHPATSSQAGFTREVAPLTDDLNRLSLSNTKKPSALPEEISSVREQDFAEIENWLATNSDRDLTSIEPISIPNSEFENFLAARAAAPPASSSQPQQQQTKSEKSIQKPEPSV